MNFARHRAGWFANLALIVLAALKQLHLAEMTFDSIHKWSISRDQFGVHALCRGKVEAILDWMPHLDCQLHCFRQEDRVGNQRDGSFIQVSEPFFAAGSYLSQCLVTSGEGPKEKVITQGVLSLERVSQNYSGASRGNLQGGGIPSAGKAPTPQSCRACFCAMLGSEKANPIRFSLDVECNVSRIARTS